MLLAHLSDLHLGTDQPGCDAYGAANGALARAVSAGAEGIVLTGDLADDGRTHQYAQLGELLECCPVPVWALAGNHDDPDRLAAVLGTSRSDRTGHLDAVADAGGACLVLLDSSRPGRTDGALSPDQLAWLDGALGATGGVRVVALHHPPFPTGIAHMDRVGLDRPSRDGLGEILAARGVDLVLCGHTHRHVTAPWAGAVAISAPSIAYEFTLDPAGGPTRIRPVAPGVLLHRLDGPVPVTHRVAAYEEPEIDYRR